MRCAPAQCWQALLVNVQVAEPLGEPQELIVVGVMLLNVTS